MGLGCTFLSASVRWAHSIAKGASLAANHVRSLRSIVAPAQASGSGKG